MAHLPLFLAFFVFFVSRFLILLEKTNKICRNSPPVLSDSLLTPRWWSPVHLHCQTDLKNTDRKTIPIALTTKRSGMKKTKIAYWTTTALIFLWEGVMPALTSNSQLAVEGVRHLGYPDYFRVMLTVFKVVGSLALILPMVPGRFKEWAYAGLGITFISAMVSHWAVDGFSGQTVFPIVLFGILAVSYTQYHKLQASGQGYNRPGLAEA